MYQKFKKVLLNIFIDFVFYCIPYIFVGILLFYDDNVFTYEQRKVLCSCFGLLFMSSMFCSFEYRDRLNDSQKHDD